MTGNAPFNNARGTASSLQLAPPFAFKDVTMSVFPLRASLSRLEGFCDAFLNHAEEAIKFQPFIPYVYLMILDYGRMSVEAANMGWISQREVAFSVPLRWMQKHDEDSPLEFRDWAFNSPFIFVDNELSMSTGREVYGWPKTLVHLDPSISQWVQDPPGSRRVFNVSIKSAGRAFQGGRFTNRPFLNVHHRPATNILEFPPNLLGLFRPLAQMPNVGLNGVRLTADLMRAMGGIAAQGMTETSAFPDLLNPDRVKELLTRENLQACLKPSSWTPGLADLLWSLFPRLYANTVNLKQFRDAASPVTACYQAITNSKMQIECVNRAGALGQQNLLMGQIDGGYSIDIYRHGNQPIIEALGLEVTASHRDGDVDIATLQPVCPFWMQLDMTYARGDVVSWRSSSTKWHWQVKATHAEAGASGTDFEVRGSDLPGRGSADRQVSEGRDFVGAEDENDTRFADLDRKKAKGGQTILDFKPTTTPTDNLYNTARGAGQAVSGPFLSPNTTIRVLPLLADHTKLEQFVSGYLDVDGYARYKPWGHHVYLVIYSYPQRTSATQNVGLIANREINFAVPVKCYDWFDDHDKRYDPQSTKGRRNLDRDKLTGTALVVPFSYVDDVTVAITSSEVEGVPTLRSAIDSPPVRWMDTDGPDNTIGSALLDSSALVLPALGVGAGARRRSFLSVSTKPPVPYRDKAGWLQIARRWGPSITADLKRKFSQRGKRQSIKSGDEFRRARAFALELMAGKLSLVNLTLKQFRDSWNTETACYQSLVQGRRKIDVLHELHEIEQTLHVSVARFPTQPIADVLGLIPKHTEVGRRGIVDVFEALRPFWLRADLSKDLGSNLFERVGDRHWSRQQHAHQLFGWHPISVEDLEKLCAELEKKPRSRRAKPKVRISYEQLHEDHWKRNEKPLKKDDVRNLKRLQQAGGLRHLMVWTRAREVSLMSNPMTLDRIDRQHVPDLAAFLESEKATPKPISELAVCVGSVDPATILDSILSRQWARPEHKRREFGKADFCLNSSSFGTIFEDRLFPESEQQQRYWPQDSDFIKSYEFIRIGIALQIHRGVWAAVNDAEPRRGFKNPKTSKTWKLNKFRTFYRNIARQALPNWFEEEVENVKPEQWDGRLWRELAESVQSLIYESYDRTSSPTIKLLTTLMKEAREQAEIMMTKPINPDDRPGEVARRLKRRLQALARPRRG